MLSLKLYAGADEIIRNECCKFLGIIIDDKLGWLDHILTLKTLNYPDLFTY